MIFQWIAAFGQGFSSFPHIVVNALLPLVDLWQMIVFFYLKFFCYHWSSFCSLGFNLHRVFFFFLFFVDCLFSFYFLGCVYSCFHLPCIFDGWVPVLGFYIQSFSFLKNHLYLLNIWSWLGLKFIISFIIYYVKVFW